MSGTDLTISEPVVEQMLNRTDLWNGLPMCSRLGGQTYSVSRAVDNQNRALLTKHFDFPSGLEGGGSFVGSWDRDQTVLVRLVDVGEKTWTTAESTPEVVEESVRRLFSVADNEIFEDGMESDLSRELIHVVNAYGEVALMEIGRVLNSKMTRSAVAAEVLRWLGRIEDDETHRLRRWLLEHGLRHESAVVRDGAIVGLGALDDVQSLKSVRIALQTEDVPELKSDLEQLREQLENPEGGYALFIEGHS